MDAQRLRAEASAWVAAQDGPRYPAALASYDRSLQLWTEAKDETQRAETLSRKGELLEMMGRLPEARTTLEDALRLLASGGRPGTGGGLPGRAGAGGDRARRLRGTRSSSSSRRSRSAGAWLRSLAEAILLNFHAVALGNLGDLSGAVAATPRRSPARGRAEIGN